jgi:hypothetical protein
MLVVAALVVASGANNLGDSRTFDELPRGAGMVDADRSINPDHRHRSPAQRRAAIRRVEDRNRQRRRPVTDGRAF